MSQSSGERLSRRTYATVHQASLPPPEREAESPYLYGGVPQQQQQQQQQQEQQEPQRQQQQLPMATPHPYPYMYGQTGVGSGSGSVPLQLQHHTLRPDSTLTKVFVGGLAWQTTSESLHDHFVRFGDIVEAVVIVDKATARSKGFGFVTFFEPEGASRAVVDANPVIDGRRANCNLAALGAKKRSHPPRRHQQQHHHQHQPAYVGHPGMYRQAFVALSDRSATSTPVSEGAEQQYQQQQQQQLLQQQLYHSPTSAPVTAPPMYMYTPSSPTRGVPVFAYAGMPVQAPRPFSPTFSFTPAGAPCVTANTSAPFASPPSPFTSPPPPQNAVYYYEQPLSMVPLNLGGSSPDQHHLQQLHAQRLHISPSSSQQSLTSAAERTASPALSAVAEHSGGEPEDDGGESPASASSSKGSQSRRRKGRKRRSGRKRRGGGGGRGAGGGGGGSGAPSETNSPDVLSPRSAAAAPVSYSSRAAANGG